MFAVFETVFCTVRYINNTIDIEWVEENFSTREPQFQNRLLQSNIEGRAGSKYPNFPVSIGNEKEAGEIGYYPNLFWWNTNKMIQTAFDSVVQHQHSLRQEKQLCNEYFNAN